jgi:hypothetical protein
VGFLREIRRTAPESHFVIASFDVRRWTRLLKDVDRITMINKPLSIWALERSLARLLGIRSDARLDEVVERFVEPSQVTRSDRREGLKKKQSVERRDEEI